MGEVMPAASARPLRVTLLLQAACGLGAAALIAADVGAGWRGLFALPVVLGGGAALGPLLAITPVEPSRLKLAVLSSLLSPLVVAALFAGLHLGAALPAPTALAGAFAACGLLPLLGLRTRVQPGAPSRQESSAVVLGFVFALAAVIDGFGGAGTSARLADGGSVLVSTLADGWLSGRGLESPWFAGGPLDLRPAGALLVAVTAGGVGAAPSFVAPLFAAWAAALVASATYLACAALARESDPRRAGARDLGAAALALLVPLAARGAAGTGGALVGDTVVLDPVEAAALAATACALLTGLHAVRSGARPWPLLFAGALMILTLLHPRAGLAFGAAMCAACVLHGRTLLLAMSLAALAPGLLQGRFFGGFAFDQVGPHQASAGGIGSVLLGLLVLGALGAPFARRSARGSEGSSVEDDDGRVRRGWTFTLAAGAFLLGWLLVDAPTSRDARALSAAAGVVLAVVAAAGLHFLPRPGLRVALLGAAVLGAAGVASRGATSREGGAVGALVDGLDGLTLVDTRDEELAGVSRALAWVRSERGGAVPAGAALVTRSRGAAGTGRASLAPLASGLPLWAGAEPPPGARQDRRFAAESLWHEARQGDEWSLRSEALGALLGLDRSLWEPRFEALLRSFAGGGTPLVVVLSGADHRRLKALDAEGTPLELARLGARALQRRGDASVYLVEAPQGIGPSGR